VFYCASGRTSSWAATITHLGYIAGEFVKNVLQPLFVVPAQAAVGAARAAAGIGAVDRVLFGVAPAAAYGFLNGAMQGVATALRALQTSWAADWSSAAEAARNPVKRGGNGSRSHAFGQNHRRTAQDRRTPIFTASAYVHRKRADTASALSPDRIGLLAAAATARRSGTQHAAARPVGARDRRRLRHGGTRLWHRRLCHSRLWHCGTRLRVCGPIRSGRRGWRNSVLGHRG